MRILCRLFGCNHKSVLVEPVMYGVTDFHFECARCARKWTEIVRHKSVADADFHWFSSIALKEPQDG